MTGEVHEHWSFFSYDRGRKALVLRPFHQEGFVIAAGGCVKGLTEDALAAAEEIGAVEVDVGDTACRVPDAAQYISKMADKGRIGLKKKTAGC